MPPVAYLSHSLSTDIVSDQTRRHNNIANAVEWYAFLFDVTSWHVVMPWFPSVVALRELHRPRSLAGQLVMLGRCDLLVLAGGFRSENMNREVDFAKRSKIAVVDLTDFGRMPPSGDLDAVREVFARREHLALQLVSALE